MKKNLPLFLFFLAFGWSSLSAQDPNLFRTIDGHGNNPNNPEWGAAHTTLLNKPGIGFADSIGAPAGADRPNPRYISNLIFNQPDLLPDPMVLSDYCWVFGQFMDHDLSLTVDGAEFHPIRVPAGDPNFDPLGFGTVMIPMMRNAFVGGSSPENPRLYVNEITAFIDGSSVYGSEESHANWLRSFEGGKLKVSSGNMLPYNTIDGEFDSPIDPDAPHMDDAVGVATRLYVAGDVRANENPLLASLHTLFVREHNRQCDLLAAQHPDWNDEQLYQYARKIVGGLIQSITFNEWLPTMGVVLPPYTGYNPEVHPQMDNVFTAAAFRVGHTLLNSNIRRVDIDGNVLPEGNLTLREAFFIPSVIEDVGSLDPYLAGMAQQTQQSMDSRIVDDVRNFLFGPPGAGGLDLAAININRGRERGLPSFNDIREAYGLSPYTFLGQITPEISTYSKLFEAYFGDIEKVDPWVAMLAEQRMPGALFGPTIMKIMEVQFAALRDGDRFFYLNDPLLTEEEKEWIHNSTFRDVIMHNTQIALMQDNVFRSLPYEEICDNMSTSVSGEVRVHTTETLMTEVRVDLFKNGEVVDNLITNAEGSYSFANLAACDPVSLRPSFAGDAWINGITVQDIVILARHILGLDPITDPYALLAADANLDGRLQVTDIITLRRLILGLDLALPGEDPMWDFVPASYSFTDPLQPWADVIPAFIDLSTPTLMMANHHFVAYKRGDINASADIGGDNLRDRDLIVGRTNASGLTIVGEDLLLSAGVPTDVLLSVVAHEEIAAYQLSLAARGAQIESVSSIDLPEGFFHLTDRGSLRFCGEQLAGTTATISVRLTSDGQRQLSEVLEMAEYDLPSLALTPERAPLAINLDLQSIPADIVDSQVVEALAFPNPFADILTVRLPNTVAGVARFELHDANGRLLLSEQRELPASDRYDWTMTTNGLPAGNYVYRVTTADGQFVGRALSVGR